MNFQFKHRQTVCPPELVEKISEKVDRFTRVLPETAYMEVSVCQHAKAQDGGDKEAEVIVDIPGVKPVIRFVAQGETFLEAVDRVLDKLDDELGKRKNRDGDHSYSGPSPKEWAAEEEQKNQIIP